MKKKILICSVVAVLFGIFIAKQQLAYPPAWDTIQLGMSRQEVYERVGPPTIDTGDIKSAFWYQRKTTQLQELWVGFQEDKVTSFYVKEHIGTKDHFYTINARNFWDNGAIGSYTGPTKATPQD